MGPVFACVTSFCGLNIQALAARKILTLRNRPVQITHLALADLLIMSMSRSRKDDEPGERCYVGRLGESV